VSDILFGQVGLGGSDKGVRRLPTPQKLFESGDVWSAQWKGRVFVLDKAEKGRVEVGLAERRVRYMVCRKKRIGQVEG
jgi:hypothetical protein